MNKAVRFAVSVMVTFLVFAGGFLDAQTVSEMAVSSYVRPEWAPKYSDVCFSSRWPRGEEYRTVEKWWGTIGTPDERPFDTIEILKMYHATRLDWIYVRGLYEIEFLPKVRALGVSVSAAQTSNLSDDYGGTGPNLIGRIVNMDSSFGLDLFNNPRGCVNNDDFRAIFLREMKLRIDAGSTSLQVDDPTLNDGVTCFCTYCLGTKYGFDSTTEFYTWLHEQLDPYYQQTYGISKYPIHGNNTSRNRWTLSYFKDEPNYRLDFGLGECDWKYLSAQHLHNVALLSRTFEGGNRAQIITAPGKYMPPEKDIVWYKALTRRHIATCYAQGMHAIAPFDRFDCNPPGAGDENQSTRYFGNPQKYADLYGFVRGIAIYMDDYEWAWDWGRTPKADEYETGPYSNTWGTAPGADEPVVSVADGVAVVLRAKPGTNDDPVAIHLVEWDNPNSFNLTLRNDKFFGESTDNLRLTLLRPLTNYNALDYATTWANLNYTYYVESMVLTGSYNAGQTTVTIPALSPWAVLMVSKGKTTPLPLYDSPRWQQLRDAAPAIAEATTPVDNILTSARQPIVLTFNQSMNSSTVNSANIDVTHMESGDEIAGSWNVIGTLAIFTPASAYKKGTIRVQLSPAVKRTTGAGCLMQKFTYTFDQDVSDITLDQFVDLADYSLFADKWLQTAPEADMSGDSYVSLLDAMILGSNWLTCYTPRAVAELPGEGTLNVTLTPKFRWEDTADEYDVYLGTDETAVADAGLGSDEYQGTFTANSFTPAGTLAGNTEYFWRVDAVGPGCMTPGAVNAFITTSGNTLAYWELDGNGDAAAGGQTLTAAKGEFDQNTTIYAAISNPDTTTPWAGADNATVNTSSLNFDGQTVLQYSSGNSPYQFKRSSPFTCEAYIRPTGGSGSTIIFGTRDGFSGWLGWYLRYDTVSKRLNLYHVHASGTTNIYSTSNVLPLNEMKHVAMVWDPDTDTNGQIRLYVNGTAVLTYNGQAYWDDERLCGWNICVGGRVADDPWGFVGQIDEMRWTPAALDPVNFLCGTPTAPAPADAPTPADDTTGVDRGVTLSWTPGARAQSHDVYFGTVSPPPFAGNRTESFFSPGPLDSFTTYYWRIDERNSQGVTSGTEWSFTTSNALVFPVTDALGYWELNTTGASAIGNYGMGVTRGMPSTDNAVYASITNPDNTPGWNGSDSSAQNTSSLYFDGNTALTHAAVENTFAFTGSQPFTCEGYIRPTGGTGSLLVIFGTRDSASGWNGWYLRYNADGQSLLFYFMHPDHTNGDAVVGGSPGEVPFNTLSHVAVVWDPSAGPDGTMTVYVNGQVDIQFAGKPAWDDTPVGKNFMVGGRNTDAVWGFVGQIDEVRWVDRALEPYEFLNAE